MSSPSLSPATSPAIGDAQNLVGKPKPKEYQFKAILLPLPSPRFSSIPRHGPCANTHACVSSLRAQVILNKQDLVHDGCACVPVCENACVVLRIIENSSAHSLQTCTHKTCPSRHERLTLKLIRCLSSVIRAWGRRRSSTATCTVPTARTTRAQLGWTLHSRLAESAMPLQPSLQGIFSHARMFYTRPF